MKATCTFGGGGPDVVLSLDGTPFVLGENPEESPGGLDRNRFLYGVIAKGDTDLTADQAHELGLELINAAKRAKELHAGGKIK